MDWLLKYAAPPPPPTAMIPSTVTSSGTMNDCEPTTVKSWSPATPAKEGAATMTDPSKAPAAEAASTLSRRFESSLLPCMPATSADLLSQSRRHTMMSADAPLTD
ncbi:MAG: hypothetical protein KDC39_10865 [Actinobacteria bacterium]|nr:hypothetical protein [Actinomycetota bacterium]